MILTQGEKMVWAAAWERVISEESLQSLDRDEGFRMRRHAAIHAAMCAVFEMRVALQEANPNKSKTTREDIQMLHAMLTE